MEQEQKIRFLHVLALQKDRRREPVATLAYMNVEDGLIVVACSLRSRRDNFSRARGRIIAEGRLRAIPPYGDLPRHVMSCEDVEDFKRVRQRFAQMRRTVTSYGAARAALAEYFDFDVPVG